MLTHYSRPGLDPGSSFDRALPHLVAPDLIRGPALQKQHKTQFPFDFPKDGCTKPNMPISVGDIVNALIALGGEAHALAITEHVISHGQEPFPADPAASVRARLQENCSSYKAYLGKADLFESAPGSGIWRLRQFRTAVGADGASVSDRNQQFGTDYEAIEGNKRLQTHLVTERDATLVRKFKAGLTAPICEACDLNLHDIYGDLAGDYIEAHHRKLVANADGQTPTRLADLAALCPNCHRVIHKNYPMSVESLRAALVERAVVPNNGAELRQIRITWRQAVRDALVRIVQRSGSRRVSRQQLINEELSQIIKDVNSNGTTPSQTASRVLQELRDLGEIDFASGAGEYDIKILK
jgi:putative restriction endonuclease